MAADESSVSRRYAFDALLEDALTYREKEVIKLRYGLSDGYTYNREEVGRIFHVTEQEAQWIEAVAIRKLQHPDVAGKLMTLAEAMVDPSEGGGWGHNWGYNWGGAEAALAEADIALPEEEECEQQHIQAIDVLDNLKELDPYLIAHLKNNENDLERLSGELFEELVAEFLAGRGFDKVRAVGTNSLTGADVLAIQKSEASGVRTRYFIETKRWKQKVGIEVVRAVLGTISLEAQDWGWHCAMLVSMSGFTDFKNYTRSDLEYRRIHLRGPDEIRQWLRDYKPSDQGLWLPPNLRRDLSDVDGPHQKK